MAEQSKPIFWMWNPQRLLDDVWHYPYAYQTFRKYVPPGKRVLEIGFGSGRILTRLAAESNCDGVGVDVDDDAFRSLKFFAQRNGASVQGVKGSGFCLPFGDNSFDVVYSEGVIEHFPPKQSEEMIAEHVRVCRESGLVIISVPNRLALFHSLTKALLRERFLFYPERSYSILELSRMMRRAGLTILKRDGFAFGCQFYMMKVFLIDEMRSALLERLSSRFLAALLKTKLYHFDHARLNSLLGFQIVAVGRKEKEKPMGSRR
jgi:SAM-dependent methyltransferase